MTSEQEMHLRQTVSRHLKGPVELRAEMSDGGWVLEVIHPALRGAEIGARHPQLFNLVDPILRDWNGRSIWKVFVAHSRTATFTEQGTLHTRPLEHDSSGIPVITLTAMDAYVDLTPFDVELISLGARPRTVEAIESRGASGDLLLPVQEGAPYVWMEVGGGWYAVQNVARQSTGAIRLTIGEA